MNLKEIVDFYYMSFDKGSLPYICCEACGNKFYYPRSLCPKCHSKQLRLCTSTGKGVIFSYTRINRKEGQLIYAIIEMNEGFRMYSNVEGKNVDIGNEVQVYFSEARGRNYPFFRLLG
ncbi:MAG: zinc ribbon domain-containing protein [Nitrososphaerota archaeon]